jgi:microcystin-dependent protein
MSYQVTYTESNNPAKPAITVADGSLNNQTSLTFVGQGYNGFAPEVAKDFLHLLENFSNSTAPSHPVEGQLWYDNTNNVLNVYDGTTWSPSGSLRKALSAPSNAVAGDLWTNTLTSQLYVYSGSNWLLVGPQFSAGTQTGPIVDEIVDINNVTHNVVSFYANNYLVGIISKESFVPKASISGFTTINEGFNLSSVDANNSTAPTRFWGTATSADALLIGNKAISASNFLRGDQPSTANYPISVKSDAGINVGSTLSFNIGVNGNSTVLSSNSNGNSVDFKLNSGGTLNTVLHLAADSKVGIGTNNTSPASTLDVAGLITSSLGLNVTGTTDSSSLGTGSIKTAGGLSVALKTNFGGDVNLNGKLYLTTASGTSAIIPTVTSQYDIGSSANSFRNVYANTFVGSFNGNVTGALTGVVHGSADKLTSATRFYLSGDISSQTLSFDGQGDDPMNFVTTISTNFITGKTAATDSASTDEFLVYRPGTGSVLKMSKDIFLNHVATVPTGSMMPYAGITPPPGYLWCDGSEVEVAKYPALYRVLGNTYKAIALLQGLNTFGLPDLRGRFPLGRDNMNNNISVPYKDGSGTLVTTISSVANRVTDITADTLGTGSGHEATSLTVANIPDHKHNLNSGAAQYYAGGVPGAGADAGAIPGLGLPSSSTGSGLPNSGSVISGTPLGTPFNTMNPYATINYIIFTGVIL